MKTLLAALAILAVTLGITTFSFSKRAQESSAQLAEAQSELSRRPAGPSSNSDDKLRELLNQQEEANRKLREEIGRLKASPAKEPKTETSPDPTPVRGAGGAWMDRLRQEDPERYKQIMEQREQRRKAADKWFQDQIAVLDQTAQTAGSQDEAEIASQIADTLAKLNDLRSQWAAVRELPQDQREEATQQLQSDTRTAYKTLNDLRTNFQDLQFGKVLAEAGVSPKVIQDTVAQINKVLKDSGDLTPPHGGGNWGGGTPGTQPQTGPRPPH